MVDDQPDPASPLAGGEALGMLIPTEATGSQPLPGRRPRRRTKIQRQAEEAERLAAMLADAPMATDDVLSPPAFIAEPRLAVALQVWRDLAPRLVERGTLERTDRYMFALFCYYQAEFIVAAADILERGYSVKVRTVSGDMMPRINPSVRRRDDAVDMMTTLSVRFGLTALDRFALARTQTASGYVNDLFLPQQRDGGRAPALRSASEEPPAPVDPWTDLIGPQVAARPN